MSDNFFQQLAHLLNLPEPDPDVIKVWKFEGDEPAFTPEQRVFMAEIEAVMERNGVSWDDIRYRAEVDGCGQTQIRISFPDFISGTSAVKVYTNTNFEGYRPVGVAAVVVAESAAEATALLNRVLKQDKKLPGDAREADMVELDLGVAHAVVLDDGNY